MVAAPRELWLHSAASLLSHPLRIRNHYSGEQLALPVTYRVSLDLGGELGLWKKRLSLGFGLPVALWQGGRATASDRRQRSFRRKATADKCRR